jgi:hypothetical protein
MSSKEQSPPLDSVPIKENEKIWAEEAERRDRAWDADPAIGVPASDVFREIRARLSGLRDEA